MFDTQAHCEAPASSIQAHQARADQKRSISSLGRPFSNYSRFGLEVFYKRSLKSFSEDLRSPYRLILEDLRREFGLRGLQVPSDAGTAACIDIIRRLADEMVAGQKRLAS